MRREGQPESSHLEILEEEVIDTLRNISTGYSGYEARVLKAGAFRHEPVHIHFPVLYGGNHRYRFTADRIAHSLTTGALQGSALAGKIRHIILLPRFIATDSYFMTHAFHQGSKILASYLHPVRLHETESVVSESRIHSELKIESRPGLFSSILSDILKTIQSGNEEVLLKYVLPLKILQAQEIREMEDLEMMIEHSHSHDF